MISSSETKNLVNENITSSVLNENKNKSSVPDLIWNINLKFLNVMSN